MNCSLSNRSSNFQSAAIGLSPVVSIRHDYPRSRDSLIASYWRSGVLQKPWRRSSHARLRSRQVADDWLKCSNGVVQFLRPAVFGSRHGARQSRIRKEFGRDSADSADNRDDLTLPRRYLLRFLSASAQTTTQAICVIKTATTNGISFQTSVMELNQRIPTLLSIRGSQQRQETHAPIAQTEHLGNATRKVVVTYQSRCSRPYSRNGLRRFRLLKAANPSSEAILPVSSHSEQVGGISLRPLLRQHRVGSSISQRHLSLLTGWEPDLSMRLQVKPTHGL